MSNSKEKGRSEGQDKQVEIEPSRVIRLSLPEEVINRKPNSESIPWAYSYTEDDLKPKIVEHTVYRMDGTAIIFDRVPAYVPQPNSEDLSMRLLDPEVGEAITEAMRKAGLIVD